MFTPRKMKTNVVETSVLFVLIQVLRIQTLQNGRQYVTVNGMTKSGDPITLIVHEMTVMDCVQLGFVILDTQFKKEYVNHVQKGRSNKV